MKAWSRRLHCFNPGNETAVGAGVANYTPDSAARRMAEDLEILPIWYASDGDAVWTTDSKGANQFLDSLPLFLRPSVSPLTDSALCRLKADAPLLAVPWGLSPHVLARFDRLRQRGAPLSIPVWSDDLRTLIHRQTAARCLGEVLRRMPELPDIEPPTFCTGLAEITDYMARRRPPFLLKTPFSCSGRGLLHMDGDAMSAQQQQWIAGALRRWGTVSIERRLDKTSDFALEFYSDGRGRIAYAGLSVFDTQPRGAFSRARLGSPDRLRSHLPDMLRGPLFDRLRVAVSEALSAVIGCTYSGFLGVDMLTYRLPGGAEAVHPFIELNLRYTMGLVAASLSRRLVHPDAAGWLTIARSSQPGSALRDHQSDALRLPACYADGRLRSGYLSLTPVTSATCFRAFVEVEEHS